MSYVLERFINRIDHFPKPITVRGEGTEEIVAWQTEDLTYDTEPPITASYHASFDPTTKKPIGLMAIVQLEERQSFLSDDIQDSLEMALTTQFAGPTSMNIISGRVRADTPDLYKGMSKEINPHERWVDALQVIKYTPQDDSEEALAKTYQILNLTCLLPSEVESYLREEAAS